MLRLTLPALASDRAAVSLPLRPSRPAAWLLTVVLVELIIALGGSGTAYGATIPAYRSTPAAYRSAFPGPVAAASRWIPPLAGPLSVVTPFEQLASRYAAGHRGVDLDAVPGATVVAPAPAVVSFAGSVAGVGVLTLTSGDRRTTYLPVAGQLPMGTVVNAGDPVARVVGGHPGCTSACLHWGLIEPDGAYRDPMLLLRRGPSRLLPLTGPAPGVDPGFAVGSGVRAGGGRAAAPGDAVRRDLQPGAPTGPVPARSRSRPGTTSAALGVLALIAGTRYVAGRSRTAPRQ